MLKELHSVSSFCFRARKMSSLFLNGRLFPSLRKLGFASAFLVPTDFTRKMSDSMVFNNLKRIAEIESFLSDPQYRDIVKHIYRSPATGRNLLVIQPRLKRDKTGRRGGEGETSAAGELKLFEAIALVQSLPDWKVAEKCMIAVITTKQQLLFGKGNLESIRNVLHMRPDINGIFFGVDILTAVQNVKLEEYFNMQVFDRYQIILRIFHAHAHTREAKLQIALAEIPYLRVKLSEYSHTYKGEILSGITNASYIGGFGGTLPEKRKQILHEREMKIKRALSKLKQQRDFLRKNTGRKSYPIVAVVGYTNCGKTSLIKALTNDDRLQPEDKLFATLDVTLHAGFLPSSQKVLYIDTVGFISDVPVALIGAFRATLEDVASADVIVHVRDISHPHSEAQKAVVLETLRNLHLQDSLMESIIEVGNKVDLLDESEVNDKEFIPVSATESINLQKLSEVIEEGVLKNTGHCIKVLRVPNGGDEYRWLHKEATISDAVVDETNYNYFIVEVIISSANYARFTHIFGDLSVCLPNET